jgi:hypothetical protein
MKHFILLAAFFLNILYGQSSYANDPSWSNELADYSNTYFKKPYQHAPHDNINKIIQGKKYTVNRPNHSLAHGMRQGFLASDILFGLKCLASSKTPITNEAKNFIHWINSKTTIDLLFGKKLQFLATFQRTGRGSEISGSQNPILYKKYKQRDASNFVYFANHKQHVGKGKLFKDTSELQLYKEALFPEGKILQTQQTDLSYLSKLINASHQLDLRRMNSFNPQTIQSTIQKILFGSAQIGTAEKTFLQNLWHRSGEYLNATGDRDVMKKKSYYSDRFYTQAHDPKSMVKALHMARKNSNIKF